MKIARCSDGGRHRWRVRGEYNRGGVTYDRWCQRCGKWYARLVQEARDALRERSE